MLSRTLLATFLATALAQDCSVFQEGSCPLEESNIVGFTNEVDNPGACQTICKYMFPGHECQFFTHFGMECYQLANCTYLEECPGCTSGPKEPDFADCPWPPVDTTTAGPELTTTEPATTEPATTTPAEETTTPWVEETTTDMPTTTTSRPECDVTEGVLCEDMGNLIEHIEHIHDVSDCQAICQNHASCEYWSHYLEEGGEHWGHCRLHYACDRFMDHSECLGNEAHECENVVPPVGLSGEPRPGGKKCFCQSGSNSPDLDECGELPPPPLPCLGDFNVGVTCDNPENLGHVTNIDRSDCQAIYQNHIGCGFFSHYQEEGGEHKGHCFIYAQCDRFTDHECAPEWDEHCAFLPSDGTGAVPFPGRRCGCFSGPPYPDVDDCSYPEFF